MSGSTDRNGGMAEDGAESAEAFWPAVWSLMMGVCGLITAEFLPAGLLTPIARDLSTSEALAGQAVTATAIVSFFAALLTSTVTRGMDRRRVLLGCSALLIASDLLVAASPDLRMLLVARALLGIALGGFWSMAAAVTIRLVPQESAPRALSVVFSGIAVASIVAVPMGSYAGEVFSWRASFLAAALFSGSVLSLQIATLPKLANAEVARRRSISDLLRRPGLGVGLACITLIYAGHFGAFTYIRPYLEEIAALEGSGIAVVLMAFGIANLAGTLVAGLLLERSMRVTLAVGPLFIGAATLGLGLVHDGMLATMVFVSAWGMAYGTMPVGWSTWIVRAVPDEAEVGGGLIVAAVQLAITAGAAGGGTLFAVIGVPGVFASGGALTLATLAFMLVRFFPTDGPCNSF